mmetsp:Transcript_11624/g.30280  ORF Transcript_11624/g.30280 Transcript_11624/m.30280 type:complete len:319 (-) Transcript_11624:132-1088(-)
MSSSAPAKGRGVTRELHKHKKVVHAVAWNSTGSRLASGSVDTTAIVWSGIADGAGVKESHIELKGHQEAVDQLCWDPQHPDRLATASGDKTVRLWDTRTARCTNVIDTRGENINIAWSPEHHIAVGNKDDDISIIDARKGKMLKTTKFPYEVNEMSWSRDGSLLFLTTGMGTVEVLRYANFLRGGSKVESFRSLQGHTANCYCVQFDPTGKHLAVGGADALVSLWSLPELVCMRTLTRLEWPVRTLSFSHDGKLLASASEDAFIDIADVDSGEQIHAISSSVAMNSIAWHPTQYLLAYAGDDKERDQGMVRVFSLTHS